MARMPPARNAAHDGGTFISKGQTMTTGTVTLHRVLRAPPLRVYQAFLDPDAMAAQLWENSRRCYRLDATR